MEKKDSNDLKEFGHKLRKIRESKGWTLEQTEEMGWPSWQHLQKIEMGSKNITFTTMRRLERLYQIKIILI